MTPRLDVWACPHCSATIELLAALEAHHTCPERGGKRVALHLVEKDPPK